MNQDERHPLGVLNKELNFSNKAGYERETNQTKLRGHGGNEDYHDRKQCDIEFEKDVKMKA